jgi:DNA-binding winged helix-turn-helix (wHTH) protein
MDRTILDRLHREAAARFFGRERELTRLESWISDDDGPAVVFVHGIGGIGKTSLLDALERRAKATAITLLRFDCGEIEPTPRGVLHALREHVSHELTSVDAAAEALAKLAGRIVLAFDDYQRFRLLDAWLRQTFIPALPAATCVLLSSREPPADGWTLSPGWSGLVHTLELDPLDDEAVNAVLDYENVTVDTAARVRVLAKGHPLLLRLAIGATMTEASGPASDALNADQVISTLAARFVEDVNERDLRRVLDCAAVLRRVTRPLLAAMLDVEDPGPLIERLCALPFVTAAQDGLVIHETVRSAVARSLYAIDPERYRALRRAAWNQLRKEVEAVGRVELWRYTADILYLVEQPSIREAFFPTDVPQQIVEPARPEDESEIARITRRHDGREEERAILAWWRELSDSFSVVRGSGGEVLGYSILAFAGQIGECVARDDAVAASWLAHVQAARLPDACPVLFARRLLTRDSGEGPSIERAACFLDIKRTYLENPRAARIYTAMHVDEEFLSVFRPLGFGVLGDLAAEQDGRRLDTLMLDFGPGGIPAWIAGLIDTQYQTTPQPVALDVASRALLLYGRNVPLTRLEYGVMRHLVRNVDRVVTRDELLRDVWDRPFGGSNVVDAVMRTLRKKLGAQARTVETVKGHGYRFLGFDPHADPSDDAALKRHSSGRAAN